MTLRQPGGEGKRLPDIRFFQVREIGEQLLDRASRSKRFHDRADRYTHASNARLSAHDLRIHCYPPELLHVAIITHRVKPGRAEACLTSRSSVSKKQLRA